MTVYDLIVIGAGPAGMAAATHASRFGITVLVLDEQSRQGGQVYRNVQNVDGKRRNALGADYASGRALADAMDESGICHRGRAVVWRVDPDGTVTYSVDGNAHQDAGAQIILATGALERAVPVPGWTLPGVMTAGAAQILLKAQGLVAENAVLAGAGPLLYLLAAQMIAAGSPPKAMIETQSWGDGFRSLPHIAGAARGWRMIAKGLGLISKIRAAGVERHTGSSDIRIGGADRAESISFLHGKTRREIPCDHVLLHHGVVPNTQISRSLGLEHRWNERQHCFQPLANAWGATSIQRINIAGDGAGIGGAVAAEIQGRLAACDVLLKLGKLDQHQFDQLSRPLMRRLDAEMAPRPFLDALYAPPESILRPADGTIICRCEEVTAGNIREFAKIGCIGPDQTKAFGRSGMGPCQGRYCGLTVTEILARENRTSQQEVGSYRIRAPLKPVTLGELASLTGSAESKFSEETKG